MPGNLVSLKRLVTRSKCAPQPNTSLVLVAQFGLADARDRLDRTTHIPIAPGRVPGTSRGRPAFFLLPGLVVGGE